MNDKVFLDTNILVYLYSEDEQSKRYMAYEFVNNYNCITSTQTLNEASNVWFKKHSLGTSQIFKYLDEIESVCDDVALIQRRTINIALSIKERYGFSYYDCLIISSALENGCTIVLTEDMNGNQFINSKLRIVNPFI